MSGAAAQVTRMPAANVETSRASQAGADRKSVPPRRTILRLLAASAGVIALGIAVYALHRFTEGVSLAEIQHAIATTPASHVLLSLLFTALSFAALASYDVLMLRVVAPGRIPVPIAAAAGASAYAIANLTGFSILTGVPLRYRMYAAEGLDAVSVSGVVAGQWLAFWLAVVVALGIALIADPQDLPVLAAIGPALDYSLGALSLAASAGVLLWIATGRRRLALAGATTPLPDLSHTLALMGASLIDISGAALALYVLLPPDLTGSVAGFLVIYLGAMTLGMISHAPGGLGTFEAAMIAGLGAAGRADALAALIVYRLVYYVLPFVLAVAANAAAEVGRQRDRLSAAGRLASAALHPLQPAIGAALVFLCGVVLLVSGTLPAEASRLQFLRGMFPLALSEAAHLLGSVIGVALLVAARGLLERLHAAWWVALGLLFTGAAASLVKGLDFEEAALLLFAAALLFPFRHAFYRRPDVDPFQLTPGWAITIVATFAAATWLGLFAYRHVEYSHAVWWQFAWNGDAPRFLRASVAVAVAIVGFGLNSLLHRRPARSRPEPIPPAVRRLVSASEETDANTALLGDKRFLLSPDDDAFLMYGVAGRSFISKGDPIGQQEAARALAWRFRELADRAGARTVFYAVGPDYLPLYLEMGLTILKIGEVARVDLASFSFDSPRARNLRYAERRAANLGLEFEVMTPDRVPAAWVELRVISDAWLESKAGEEKAFALGNFNPAYLANFDCAVIRHGERILAFANLWRGANGSELSIDLMRHIPDAPRVTMDALFAKLFHLGQAEGYRWFNLGAAPLAGLSDHPLARSWNHLGTLIYRHGERFYHFEGLRAFKQKFDPVWTPQYLACPGGVAVPKVLLDVNALISGGASGLLRC